MALPESIMQSMLDAEASVRNALAFAARSEDPLLCATLSQILRDVDSVKQYDEILKKKDSGDWNDFFGGKPPQL
ncbi:hypothetical protein [Synechococcus phage S-B68]|nr:hypothetical protein [Synechococcus phage S-B68]